MVYKNFQEIVDAAKSLTETPRIAVAAANDDHTLGAIKEATLQGLVKPVLVGDKELIKKILKEIDFEVPDEDIYNAVELSDAAFKTVELVRTGKADCILKGKLDTGIILKAVVNKETGIGLGGVMSHFTLFEIPGFDRLIAAVDGGMVTYPTLEQKKAIIENTVLGMRALGYEEPKVGVLACIEKINPKMPETLDGDALKQMNQRGEIKHCIVEGPISYDCALVPEIAEFKGFKSPCAGCCDILIAPNIQAGNILGKALTITAHAKMAGVIVGAKCPIAMVSRGSSAEEKFISIVMAALVAKGMQKLAD